MVDDLAAHHKLIGLHRNGLAALLGTPDDVEAFRERSRRGDDDTSDVGYELGPQRGSIVRIDNDWLLPLQPTSTATPGLQVRYSFACGCRG